MIRDEFLKQQKDKSLSTKDIAKIRKIGERAFYSNQIRDIELKLTAFKFSLVVIGIFILLGIGGIILILLEDKTFTNELIIPIVVTALFVLAEIIVLVFSIPKLKRKMQRAKQKVEELRQEQIKKQQAIYKSINK
jgi:ABC-type siderophore export system fused ATPase/permease subunit